MSDLPYVWLVNYTLHFTIEPVKPEQTRGVRTSHHTEEHVLAGDEVASVIHAINSNYLEQQIDEEDGRIHILQQIKVTRADRLFQVSVMPTSMIETFNESSHEQRKCKHCHTTFTIPLIGDNRLRRREFCSEKCKSADYRRRKGNP